MRRIVVFGATSAIAQAALRHFANDGDEILLIARDRRKLEAVQGDLAARGAAQVDVLTADLADLSGHAAVLNKVREAMPDYDHAFFCYGSLGDQKACQADYTSAEAELRVNFLSVVSLLTDIANHFEEQRKGRIIVVTSVAGDRGRQSNYVYGTAKGALGIFLQGLRNRLEQVGVGVLTVKPGFVDTPMTSGMKRGPLFASADRVGLGIYQAVLSGRNVVYLPWFWFFIMLIVKALPEAIFKRLRL